MQRTFGAAASALPVVVSDEVTTASTASRRKTTSGDGSTRMPRACTASTIACRSYGE